jgi:NDP-sugar pyrophosphorylase family protein
MVWIGDSVTLKERVIIKDNCIIEDNVTIGADTVVPPFTRISAKNPLLWIELPPSMAVHMQDVSLERYQQFKKEERERQ